MCLELKDNHLSTDKSRSSSTSTITPSSLKQSASASTSTLVSNDGTIVGSSEKSTSTVSPGLLIVTIHESQGLTMPGGSNFANSNGRPTSSSSKAANVGSVAGSHRPSSSSSNHGGQPHGHTRALSKLFRTYCVLEFDKTQVIVNAISGTLDAPTFAGSATQYKFDVSRDTDLSCGIYMRNPGSGGREEDLFLGNCKVQPRFEEPVPTALQGKKGQPPPAPGQSGIEWVQLTGGTGSLRIGVEYRKNQVSALGLLFVSFIKKIYSFYFLSEYSIDYR